MAKPDAINQSKILLDQVLFMNAGRVQSSSKVMIQVFIGLGEMNWNV